MEQNVSYTQQYENLLKDKKADKKEPSYKARLIKLFLLKNWEAEKAKVSGDAAAGIQKIIDFHASELEKI